MIALLIVCLGVAYLLYALQTRKFLTLIYEHRNFDLLFIITVIAAPRKVLKVFKAEKLV
jgi:hypothetical protein